MSTTRNLLYEPKCTLCSQDWYHLNDLEKLAHLIVCAMGRPRLHLRSEEEMDAGVRGTDT